MPTSTMKPVSSVPILKVIHAGTSAVNAVWICWTRSKKTTSGVPVRCRRTAIVARLLVHSKPGSPGVDPRRVPDRIRFGDLCKAEERRARERGAHVIDRADGVEREPEELRSDGATPGNDYCNGSIAPILGGPVVAACLCDCLHADDVADLIVKAGLDKRPAGM